jgi:hypothetical protein
VTNVNVNVIACINGLGDSIPPVLIFPRVLFKIYMLNSSPPDSHGNSHPSSWSNSGRFIKFLDHFINHVKSIKDMNIFFLIENRESNVFIAAITEEENGIIMLTLFYWSGISKCF